MILQSLNDLYERLSKDESYGLSKPGYSIQKISYRIVIRMDGTLFDPEDARTPNEKGKMHSTPLLVPGEATSPGAGINPGFLWGNQTYVLGRQPEDKKDGFGKVRFEAFREKHLQLENSINSERFSAVCRFLEQWSPDQLEEHPKLNDVGTGFGVFQILGESKDIHEDLKIIEWWESQLKTQNQDEIVGQCLITGKEAPIARLHPKIKGVPGSQSAGASIVSFNDTAYESYTKTQSFNSPVSGEAAFRYGASLNALLTGPKHSKHRIRVGDTTCVFWTEKPSFVEDAFADVFGFGSNATEEVQDQVQRKKIELLLDAVRDGGAFRHDQNLGGEQTPFYILGLAPNAARLSIRFFHRSTTTELLKKLRDHQTCMKLIREFPNPVGNRHADPEFPAVWQILRETARVSDEIAPLLGGAIVRAIIEGTPYPQGLFTAIVRRVHLDRHVNYLRAATLKAILQRNHKIKITVMLDTENDNQAYLQGRLFATLEKIQEEGHYAQTQTALKSTIKEKYFSSACATPQSVFPRLETLSTHHRRHLDYGRKIFFDQLIAEIKWKQNADNIASTNNLNEQGLFILGYYHQRKDLFTSKKTTEASQPELITQ